MKAVRVWILSLLLTLETCLARTENGLNNSDGKVQASNILVLIPFNSRSHKNMFVPIIESLAQRGHQLDVISFFDSPGLAKYPSVRDTVIELGPDAPTMASFIDPSVFKSNESPFLRFLQCFSHFYSLCDYLLAMPQMRQIIGEIVAGRYQAVLINAFMCECLLPLAHLAQAPLVLVAPSHLMPWNYPTIGASVNYAQDAVFFLPYTDKKTFFEKSQAAVMGSVAHLIRDWVYLPKIQSTVQKALQEVLGEEKAAAVPPVWQIERERTALVLVNWHWSFGAFVRPNPPNLVEVGTIHCREPRPLPQDLESFIAEGGEHGFIVLSLGSTVPGHFMPADLQKTFLRAFAQLPQRVIWKYEKKMEEEVPENVLVRPWLPQQDLLGDKRLRLFITQAGMLSLQEAAWHGAPVIMAPLIVDQKSNAAVAKGAGLGLEIELNSATEASVTEMIRHVIENTSYAEAARQLSQRLRDQPERASERAVWWVEYAIRHNGTRHLRPPAAALDWPQVCLLNVVLAAAVVFVAAVAACKAARPNATSKRKVD